MTKKLNPILVQNELAKHRVGLFTPLEFQRLFNVSEKASISFIFDHSRRGFFVKLKNGLYALAASQPSEFTIANRLYQPSYVSFEYAMSYHHIIPETVYAITSATTKPTREFEALDKVFNYYKIKTQAFLGYEPRKIEEETVLIAEPEKALVDYLYFVSLGKRRINKRLSVKKISKKKALNYASAFGRGSLLSLTKEVL